VLVVALDGPAGAGKSTVSKALADRLGVPYLDTGAMYRAITLAALRDGVDPADEPRVAALAEVTVIDISRARVLVDGADATAAIRSSEVNAAVSVVAANPAVRLALRGQQRAWAEREGGGVVEGRDIGSVVFPDASLKVYLTASPRERAIRRAAEVNGDVDEIEVSIAARDHLDSTRADSPLVVADGSVIVDTDGRTVGEVIDAIVALLDEHAGGWLAANEEGHG
jgi:CMP/dCMP kinase